MYASVHTDHTGRVFISDDHRASGWDGSDHVELSDAVPLPAGARVVTLEREARAFGRDGRMRGLGRGRLALGAELPAGHTRLLFPSYTEERAAPALEPLPYAALAAAPGGELVVAAAARGDGAGGDGPASEAGIAAALRSRPRNDLLRQLSRCARDHGCAVARAALAGGGELPVPIGAPPAERPTLPIRLRSGYPGSPKEPAALHPSPEDIAALVTDRVERVSFGRACDGEPLLAGRAMEDAAAAIRATSAGVAIHLETTGCSASALRRAFDAGVSSLTIRIVSAIPETYSLLHRPVSHEWGDVRASLTLAAERGVPLTIAVLLLPGLSDRAREADALLALIGDLPGGTIELRDLGADPLRTLGAIPRGRPLGMRSLLVRIGEADHFTVAGATRPQRARA